jgi:hypothetical protein
MLEYRQFLKTKEEKMFEMSSSIVKISQALGGFHKSMGVIYKEDTNPFFKSKYASLPVILKGIKQPLTDNNLVFAQFPVNENELTTILIHTETGEYFKGTYKMTPSKNDPQGQGSLISYMKRYALGAILGLSIDEDDDGNKVSQQPQPQRPVYQKSYSAPATPSTPPNQTAVVCPTHKLALAEKEGILVCPMPGCTFQLKKN